MSWPCCSGILRPAVASGAVPECAAARCSGFSGPVGNIFPMSLSVAAQPGCPRVRFAGQRHIASAPGALALPCRDAAPGTPATSILRALAES